MTETRWMPSPQSPGASGVNAHSPGPPLGLKPRSLLMTTLYCKLTFVTGWPEVTGDPLGAAGEVPTRMPSYVAFSIVNPVTELPDPALVIWIPTPLMEVAASITGSPTPTRLTVLSTITPP